MCNDEARLGVRQLEFDHGPEGGYSLCTEHADFGLKDMGECKVRDTHAAIGPGVSNNMKLLGFKYCLER